ncbi:MAG: acyl-ACP--UDP-N-acetylglucosamine O-acyltransferase, partial [Planctomycetes bacterium]|nr:acyl-ACP--UDP-N-acetylglucosamine O-acyltransferase [Planctomycetota bacterium]
TESRLIIGSRNVIREFATIHRATTPGGATRIGDDCFLMAHSHVAHDCRLDDGVTLCNNALLAGHVQVGRRAFVSGNVVVHQFTRIGELCMISGGSAVGQDVLPYCTVTGRSQVRSMNVVGMRRAGINQAHRQAIKQACRAFFAARHDLAIAQLAFEEAPDLPEIRVLRDFVAAGSKRGYARPPRGRVEED